MNRKESPKDNVPFLLGSLVRPIGRSVPGKCQEDQAAAIRPHSCFLSRERDRRCRRFGDPKNVPPWCSSLPVVGAHVYRAIDNRMEVVAYEFSVLPSSQWTSEVDGSLVFRSHIVERLSVMLSKRRERQSESN